MMTLDRRCLFGCAVVAVPPGLLLCLLLWSPDLVERACQAPWAKPVDPDELRREERLDREAEQLRLRLEIRRAIACDLAEGRLTLLEAAARFRDLDRRAEGFMWEEFRRNHRGSTDDERHCYEAIGQLRSHAPLGDEQAEELARRLEEELRDRLARGTLRLPKSAE